MTDDLVIIGAGGFGRETLDVVDALNAIRPTWRVLGVADDALSAINARRLEARQVPHLGGLKAIPAGVAVVVAIGNPTVRQSVVGALAGRHPLPSLIHPTTVIGSEFRHGGGLVVIGGVSIGTNVSLGDHVHLNAHAVIGHDARLDYFVSVNPNATISGECVIGPRTLVGASSTVLQRLTIGAEVTIGAGALVARPVSSGATVKGVPAR